MLQLSVWQPGLWVAIRLAVTSVAEGSKSEGSMSYVQDVLLDQVPFGRVLPQLHRQMQQAAWVGRRSHARKSKA